MSVIPRSCSAAVVLLLVSVVSHAETPDRRLIEAVKHQNAVVARALIQQHIDVNAAQPDGATALHWAVHHDDLALAELLIRAGARVNAANDIGITPIALACTNRSAAMVNALLMAGANPNVAALPTGETPLMAASRTGAYDVVSALLAGGADVDARETAYGQTALMWAVANRHPDVVRVLIANGANVRTRSNVRRVLAVDGPRGGGVDASVIQREEGGSSAMFFAARVGDVESAELLLDAGADVNDEAPDGASVLVMAAHSNHRPLASLLLARGANPNAARAGYTALHAAVLRGDVVFVKELLAHGADPNARLLKGTPVRRMSKDFALRRTLMGATPFLLAAKFLERDMLLVLLSAGADPALGLQDGSTPLIMAAGLGVSNSADPNGNYDRRDRHMTPPEVEAFIENLDEEDRRTLEVIRLLVDLGADVTARNQDGNTALHAAASQRGLRAVIQFLVDQGARLDTKNGRGATPLGVALAQRQDDKSTADWLRQLGATE